MLGGRAAKIPDHPAAMAVTQEALQAAIRAVVQEETQVLLYALLLLAGTVAALGACVVYSLRSMAQKSVALSGHAASSSSSSNRSVHSRDRFREPAPRERHTPRAAVRQSNVATPTIGSPKVSAVRGACGAESPEVSWSRSTSAEALPPETHVRRPQVALVAEVLDLISEESRRLCMSHLKRKEFKAGSVIAENSSLATHLCFVEAGHCVLTAPGKEVQDVPVGESICEDAFLRFLFTLLAGSRSSDDASMRHRGQVKAVSNCVCSALSAKTLMSILEAEPDANKAALRHIRRVYIAVHDDEAAGFKIGLQGGNFSPAQVSRAPSYSSMQGSERLEENGACASEQQRVVDALSAGASLHTGLDVYKDAVRQPQTERRMARKHRSAGDYLHSSDSSPSRSASPASPLRSVSPLDRAAEDEAGDAGVIVRAGSGGRPSSVVSPVERAASGERTGLIMPFKRSASKGEDCPQGNVSMITPFHRANSANSNPANAEGVLLMIGNVTEGEGATAAAEASSVMKEVGDGSDPMSAFKTHSQTTVARAPSGGVYEITDDFDDGEGVCEISAHVSDGGSVAQRAGSSAFQDVGEAHALHKREMERRGLHEQGLGRSAFGTLRRTRSAGSPNFSSSFEVEEDSFPSHFDADETNAHLQRHADWETQRQPFSGFSRTQSSDESGRRRHFAEHAYSEQDLRGGTFSRTTSAGSNTSSGRTGRWRDDDRHVRASSPGLRSPTDLRSPGPKGLSRTASSSSLRASGAQRSRRSSHPEGQSPTRVKATSPTRRQSSGSLFYANLVEKSWRPPKAAEADDAGAKSKVTLQRQGTL